MANQNDEKILQLKAQIKEKEGKLKTKKKFTPITNCSIELDSVRHNIQALSKELLISLLVRLNSYKMSVKDLGLEEEYTISKYKLEDWITDIKLRLEIISQKEEEYRLKDLESKLHVLLSNDKKVELEINDIESEIKSLQ